MTLRLRSDEVWAALEKELFGVLGMVTAKGEARTVGIVYQAMGGKVYIATGKETWKSKHVRNNPHVSMTVTIPKRIPLMPFIKIPAATITFSGMAQVVAAEETDDEVKRALLRGLADDAELVKTMCVIAVEPKGDFITYGIGVPMMKMRHPEQARGRAPVR